MAPHPHGVRDFRVLSLGGSDEPAEILIYGDIGAWWDEDSPSDLRIVSEIQSISAQQIRVRINSYGGSVKDALAIHNALRMQSRDRGAIIETIDDGVAVSAAHLIFMAGDSRLMNEGSVAMVHAPWGVIAGNATQQRRSASALDKHASAMISLYASATGREKDEIAKWLESEEEFWFDAAEAVAEVLATGIIPARTQEGERPRNSIHGADITNAVLSRYHPPAKIYRALISRLPSMSAKTSLFQPSQPALDPDPGPVPIPIPIPTPPPVPVAATDIAAAELRGAANESARQFGIRERVKAAKLPAEFGDGLIADRLTLEQASDRIFAKLAEDASAHEIKTHVISFPGGDSSDKFIEGASQWLALRTGYARHYEASIGKKVDPGEFRGMTLMDLARASLSRAGIDYRGKSVRQIAGMALMPQAASGGPTQGRDDFPIMLENVMHKVLLADFELQPHTWRLWCDVGSNTDFRYSNRYRRGSLSELDDKTEQGEFLLKTIPDAQRERIRLATKGNRIGLSRQATIDDDMGGFLGLALDLSAAAALGIEKATYAMLVANPVLHSDSTAVLHANHLNIAATPAAPSMAAFDAARVQMKQQKDPSGNNFLNIAPTIWIGPDSIAGAAMAVNAAQWNPSANLFEAPNIVQNMFTTMQGTPYLSGTAYYMFADPKRSPVYEVVFLDGQQSPIVEMEEGFAYDGAEWRVLFDWAVGPVGHRGIIKNAGV